MTRVAVLTDSAFDPSETFSFAVQALSRHVTDDAHTRLYTAGYFCVDTPDYFAAPSVGMRLPWDCSRQACWPPLFRLERALRAQRPDLIHVATSGLVGLAARRLARRLDVPLVGSYEHRDGGRGRLLRWRYAPCQLVVVPSIEARTALTDAGLPARRLAVWPGGVDSILFSPSRRSAALRDAWHVDERRPALLYSGPLSRESGVELLPVVQRILDRRRVPHQLVITGDGPMRDMLHQACPDAVFTGRIQPAQMATVMASADLLIAPRMTDTFGSVVLDAQASGIPVLAAQGSRAAEFVLDGGSGWICGLDDAVAFSGWTSRLFQRSGLRTAMGAAARQHALRYDWATVSGPLVRAWQDAAAGGASLGTAEDDAKGRVGGLVAPNLEHGRIR